MDLFEAATENEELSCFNHTEKKSSSYPGEACEADGDCYSFDKFTSKCVDKKCSGAKAGEDCLGTFQCLVGNYCNATLKCEAQKKLDSDCTGENISECENTSKCYKKKCTKFFSLKVGTKIEEGDKNDILCEYALLKKGVCVKSAIVENVNATNFFECELGKTGTYNYTDDKDAQVDTDTKPCECGYNKDGKSYYPIATLKSKIKII
jgi:hypothetical protein